MRSVLWFALGVAAASCLSLAAGWLFVRTAAGGFSVNRSSTNIEAWAARQARDFALTAEEKNRKNPVPNGSEVLQEARNHWADHCAICHANDGSGQDSMGVQMYPPAPDMRKRDTQQMTDGELFYVIQNGIRMSGMPAWGSDHGGEEDSWKLVHFIRHLPQVSGSEIKEMKKLNPKSPEELKEQQEEEQFLTGQPSSSAPSQHQHQ